MTSYYDDQLANHEMEEAYNSYIESLTEEEFREERKKWYIPDARIAADRYMDKIFGEILHSLYTHAYNRERWYRRRDLRYKPFFLGYIEGRLKGNGYSKHGTYEYVPYTEEEIINFSEQYASIQVPENNNKQNLIWNAYNEGFLKGVDKGY